MDKKIEHLKMIQDVVRRMAYNSFLIKGWTVALLTGVFIFSGKTDVKDVYLVLVALGIVAIFWILDGYFLAQERIFRHLYNGIRQLEEEQIDFAMNIKKYEKRSFSREWICSTFSLSLNLFYGILIIILLVILYLTIR